MGDLERERAEPEKLCHGKARASQEEAMGICS